MVSIYPSLEIALYDTILSCLWSDFQGSATIEKSHVRKSCKVRIRETTYNQNLLKNYDNISKEYTSRIQANGEEQQQQ